MKAKQYLIELPLALIIEDDTVQAAFLERAMEEAGFQVCIIYDGLSARDWLQHNVPAIILLDLHLPLVNGDVLLKQINEDDRFDQTRVIIISGDGTFSGFLEENATLILNKPVGHYQLQALSRRFLHPYFRPSGSQCNK